MSWTINKTFDFCYSHRVFNQVLDKSLSVDGKCACRGNHGHNGQVIVFLKGEELNTQGMVLDFRNLQFFKVWLDEVLDHKCILSINDPALKMGYPILDNPFNEEDYIFQLLNSHLEGYLTIKKGLYEKFPDYHQEIYESLVLVNFIPTSENLARWLFEIIQTKLEGYVIVEKVEFWETPKSCSTYYG